MYDEFTPYVPAFDLFSTSNINLIPEPITTESENTTPTSNSPDSPVTDDYPIITQPDEPEQAEPLFDKSELKKVIDALKEEGWVISMQEELNQFERKE
ncbi:hypothetical protein Tco_0220860, partial [Tanacetum coccineum]